MKFARKVTESLKVIRLYSTIWLNKLTQAYITDDPEKILFIQKRKILMAYSSNCVHMPIKTFIPMQHFFRHCSMQTNQNVRTIRCTIRSHPSLNKKCTCHILNTLSYAKSASRYTIPPIKKVVDLPQFDGYHKYAVDIHSLRCLYYLGTY